MNSEIETLFELSSQDNIRPLLARRVNDLIEHDFNKLISLLYRFDISEKKLKKELERPNKDAGEVIADLIIERAKQKEISRKQFRQNTDDIAEEDKW